MHMNQDKVGFAKSWLNWVGLSVTLLSGVCLFMCAPRIQTWICTSCGLQWLYSQDPREKKTYCGITLWWLNAHESGRPQALCKVCMSNVTTGRQGEPAVPFLADEPVEVHRDFRRISHQFQTNFLWEEYMEYPSIERKQNRKMSTCSRLGLEQRGSWPTMPKNFPSAREVFGHVESVKILVILNPAGYMLTSSGFAFIQLGYSIDSSKLMGNRTGWLEFHH